MGLFYSVEGSGPSVLLLHPAGYDSRFWSAAAPLFGESFTTIVPDRPGHGATIDELSLRRPRATTAEQYRQLVAELRGSDDEARRLEAGELDHHRLAGVMAEVLATTDATPYVDWVMTYDRLDSLGVAERELVRDMVTHNTLPALFARGYSPGDLGPEELAAIRARVLDLRAGPVPASDAALAGRLAHAELVRDHIPATPPLFALSAPREFAERVTLFLRGTS